METAPAQGPLWQAESRKEAGGRDFAYDRQVDSAVREELVVKTRQVRSTSILELEGQLRLDGEGVLALDDVDEFLLVLLDLVARGAEVLDDVCRTVEAGEGGNVVQGGVLGQRGRVWRG